MEAKEELKNKTGYVLTKEERKQYGLIAENISHARNQREQARDEWDGLSYEEVYLANKRASTTYLTPKHNDEEVRINTGTTEKRIELVVNELLGMNLEAEILAFDKNDNLLQETSEVFTDVVRRTNEMEESEDKDIYRYIELLTQPSLFFEELWITKPIAGRINGKKRCENRMVQGPQIYLGDINIPEVNFNDQPFIVKYERMGQSLAKRLLRPLNPDRFDDHVKPGRYETLIGDYKIYREWAMEKSDIEAYWYMSYPDNEIQCMVGGIPMLDVGTKYTDVFGDYGGYHIGMVGLKPYSYDFAYSKPLTQSAKTLQALDNETIRNLIRKFRQALEPPLGVPEGKVYDRSIWEPGAMAQGVRAKDFERLIDHNGVTDSEMQMFKLLEEKTNEFIGVMPQQPLQTGSVTATELMEAQKMAVKMLGMAVLGAIRMKKKMTNLRIKNILMNYTKAVGKKVDPISKELNEVYAKFTISDARLGDEMGTKTIEFSNKRMSGEEKDSLFAEEERASNEGKPFLKKLIDVDTIKNMDMNFFVSVSAKQKESSQLDKAMLNDMLGGVAAVFKLTGRMPDANKLTQRFERVHKEKGLFAKENPPQQPMPGQPPQGQTPPGMQNMGEQPPQKPSVNTMMNPGATGQTQ